MNAKSVAIVGSVITWGFVAGIFAVIFGLGDLAARWHPALRANRKKRYVFYTLLVGTVLFLLGLLSQIRSEKAVDGQKNGQVVNPTPNQVSSLEESLGSMLHPESWTTGAVKGWYLYKSPDGAFEIRLPEKPKITQTPGTLMLHSRGPIGGVGILRKDNPLGKRLTSGQLGGAIIGNLETSGFNIMESNDSEKFIFDVTASNGETRMIIRATSTAGYFYQLIITEPTSQATDKFGDQRHGCFNSFQVFH